MLFSLTAPKISLLYAGLMGLFRSAWVTHFFGGTLFLGRLAYAVGITQTHGKSAGRFSGMIMTLACLVGLSIMMIEKGI